MCNWWVNWFDIARFLQEYCNRLTKKNVMGLLIGVCKQHIHVLGGANDVK
uniref:Uncharacterized protein n=1 Tax=Setaria italica TaxID=4555 RepID=K3YNX1_SETIT